MRSDCGDYDGVQLGGPLAAAGTAEEDPQVVADGFIAAAGEDRGQADQTCAVPLADTGGMDTHAAAFGGYGVPDFRPTGADGEGETGASAKSAGKVGRVKGGHMEIIEKMQLGRFEELKPGEGDI